MVILFLSSRKRHNKNILPQFCLTKNLTQCSYLTLQYFLILYHIYLVQHHYHLLHKQLCYYYTFSSLSLNTLCCIYYQKHYVYYLSTSYYCTNQRCMTRTVHQCELQVLFLELRLKTSWHSGKKSRETKIESDTSLLRLWIFIKTSSRGDLAEYSTNGCFSRIDMTKYSNINIKTFIRLYSI